MKGGRRKSRLHMERTEPPDFEVHLSQGDVPWRPVGKAWVNEDGSIFIILDLSETTFMLVRRQP